MCLVTTQAHCLCFSISVSSYWAVVNIVRVVDEEKRTAGGMTGRRMKERTGA